MAARKSPTKPKNSVAAARSQRSGGGTSFRKTWEWFKSIAGTIAIFLVLRTFFIEAYRIPSGSMIPTMLVGDWLFVNKLRLGPQIPFTNYSLPGYASPKRGDVVVFTSPPQDPSIRITPDEVTPTLVKRIVGIAGDTLLMRHGQLFVNGTADRGAQPPRMGAARGSRG